MPAVYLGLGSNLGDKEGNIKKALALITKRVGEILALSGFYETLPWGYASPETYLNAVAGIKATPDPEDLLRMTQEIEREMGRTEKTVDGRYHDRLIDIDILLYGDLVMQTPGLTVPHPRMCRRLFVLEPLCEIAPFLVHPVLKKTVKELSEELKAQEPKTL
ncbi:MAG: 2-amino-4-hydroxy-6-hydroxymethyldihydropteridine diphosphokinase [Tannerella sp.]|nr:2-amino-4-hydroxy-6-hydroxymethyldihydropteridine diphosphokinase [Tannerella sp.]